jgi:hypothetical protein
MRTTTVVDKQQDRERKQTKRCSPFNNPARANAKTATPIATTNFFIIIIINKRNNFYKIQKISIFVTYLVLQSKLIDNVDKIVRVGVFIIAYQHKNRFSIINIFKNNTI